MASSGIKEDLQSRPRESGSLLRGVNESNIIKYNISSGDV